MKLGKVNYVITDFETTGLPEEDERHRPYQWAWTMLAVDYDAQQMFVYAQKHFWLDHGLPESVVSEFTRNSECYRQYLEARQFGPGDDVHAVIYNPLEIYDRFVASIMTLRSEDYQPFQVGANPSFDRQFIDHMQREREVRHHLKHRMIDTDSVAMHALGLPYPIGLEESIQRLYDKPCFKLKHEAPADVFCCEKIVTDYLINPLLKPEGKHLEAANP